MPDAPYPEAVKWMGLPKAADQAAWVAERTTHGVSICAFGVTDTQGLAIPGLQVIWRASMAIRGLPIGKDVLTLAMRTQGRFERIFQIEISRRSGVRMSDHAASHIHTGTSREALPEALSQIPLRAAIALFCEHCSLTLDAPLTLPDDFQLR